MNELFREIWDSVNHNKLRSLLAGFGVEWGIFILIVMLGVGNGFRKGTMDELGLFAQKTIYVTGGSTSTAFRYTSQDTKIQFNTRFLQALKANFQNDIKQISPEQKQYLKISHRDKIGTFPLLGINEAYFAIKGFEVQDGGREINSLDRVNKRNVAIVGKDVANALFNTEKVVGEKINIGNVFFEIVGVLSSNNLFSLYEGMSVYIPSSSALNIYRDEDDCFSSFCLSLNSITDATIFEEKIRNYIAYSYQFNVTDKQALYITNVEKEVGVFEQLFRTIEIFIWIVGACFLLSGIVGICNVMFVTVKERIPEIGIRQAIGAKPNAIMSMLILEAISITLVAGIVGIVLGYTALIIINWALVTFNSKMTIIQNPFIDIETIIFALIILMIFGMLAGLIPAMKASRVMPIDAIRYENRD